MRSWPRTALFLLALQHAQTTPVEIRQLSHGGMTAVYDDVTKRLKTSWLGLALGAPIVMHRQRLSCPSPLTIASTAAAFVLKLLSCPHRVLHDCNAMSTPHPVATDAP